MVRGIPLVIQEELEKEVEVVEVEEWEVGVEMENKEVSIREVEGEDILEEIQTVKALTVSMNLKMVLKAMGTEVDLEEEAHLEEAQEVAEVEVNLGSVVEEDHAADAEVGNIMSITMKSNTSQPRSKNQRARKKC